MSCTSPPSEPPPIDTPAPHIPSDDDMRKYDATPSTANETSLLFTLSAGALGSLGFGLSVFVMWLRWVVPPTIPTPTTEVPIMTTSSLRSRRRRSAPLPVHNLTPPVRRATLPTTSSFLEEEAVLHRSKHVSFLDPALPSARSGGFPREPFLSEQVLREEPLPQPLVQTQPPVDGGSRSSVSSSSTLVHNPTQMDVDPSDEPVSDSSSRRSFSRRLPKMKNPFIGKARRRPSSAEPSSKTYTSSATVCHDTKSTSKLNPSLTAQQPAMRTPDAASEVTSPKSARRPFGCRNSKHIAVVSSTLGSSSDSVRSPSSSCFSRKTDRRSSAPVPIPRTSPYEAPYFATPPSPFDASYTPQSRRISAVNGLSLRSSPSHGSDGQENRYPSSRKPNDATPALDDKQRPASATGSCRLLDY